MMIARKPPQVRQVARTAAQLLRARRPRGAMHAPVPPAVSPAPDRPLPGKALALPSGMAFRKILVPVDFSPHAGEALRIASELAKQFDATITVATVFHPTAFALPEGAVVPSAMNLAGQLAEHSGLLERAAAQVATTSGRPVDTQLLQGVPTEEILGLARRGGYDLVVMGTHGRTGLGHVLLGSVAETVVRKAPCAVLTTRMPPYDHDK